MEPKGRTSSKSARGEAGGWFGKEAASRKGLGYVFALASLTLAAVLRLALPQVLEEMPFLSFYPAVVAAAMVGGFGPGMVATLGSILCYFVWFDPTPGGSFASDLADWIRIVVFLAGGMGVSLLARLQRLAHARQRRLAQEAMEQAAFHHAVMANMGEGLYTVDVQGLVTYMNEAAERLFGRTSGELPGRRIHETHHPNPDGTPIPIEHCTGCQELQQCRILTNREDVFIRKDGTLFPVLYSSAPIFAEGRIVSLVVVFRDMTAQKQAEAAQRKDQECFSAFMRHLPGAAWMKDLQGRYLMANPKVEEISGRTLHEIKGRTDEEIFPPDAARHFRDNDYRALTEGVVEAIELLLQADGVVHHSNVSRFVVRGPDGQPACIGGVAFDITERKLAEEVLHESEERFRILADNSPVILWMADTRGSTQFVNRTYREFFGVGLEEAKGRHWHPLVHPDDAQTYVETYMRAVQERTPFTAEARVRRADGAWRWITSYADPRFTASGEFLGHVGITSDITERKQAEQQLREINRTLEQRVAERTAEAEQRAEELRALAGELARTEQREQRRLAQWLHDDLQQLLVATKMQIALTQAAITEPGLRELLEKASRLIDESIGQSRSLTSELSPPILYESGLVPGLEQLSRWIEEKHQLRVTVEARADVKPENQQTAVILFNVTRELLFNVVKHAKVSEARVTLSEKGGRIQLTVEDDGSGFDPALVREGAKGGFGLLNVRERLRLIGGELQVKSSPGQGTCITLLAPASPTEAAVKSERADTRSSAAVGAASSEPAPSGGKREGSRAIRVLLVDDHRMVREGLAGLLGHETGVEVVGQASDGFEAVELARKLKPDVITMDVSMPGMNGIEATRRIKSELPQVRVIGLSMHGEKEQGPAMFKAGADAYLNKCGPSEELLLTIQRLARQKDGESQAGSDDRAEG